MITFKLRKLYNLTNRPMGSKIIHRWNLPDSHHMPQLLVVLYPSNYIQKYEQKCRILVVLSKLVSICKPLLVKNMRETKNSHFDNQWPSFVYYAALLKAKCQLGSLACLCVCRHETMTHQCVCRFPLI